MDFPRIFDLVFEVICGDLFAWDGLLAYQGMKVIEISERCWLIHVFIFSKQCFAVASSVEF